MIDYVLKYSLESKMPINIMYMKGTDISQRQIQIRAMEGNIIHAYCHAKKALRNFRKDNILAAMIPGVQHTSYGNTSIKSN